jgi:hypothetical protein
MSSTTGPRDYGMSKAVGFVPNAARVPPNGATLRAELAVWMQTRFALAIIST